MLTLCTEDLKAGLFKGPFLKKQAFSLFDSFRVLFMHYFMYIKGTGLPLEFQGIHLLPLTTASPEQYPQIRLLFSYKCKTRKKSYDKAGQGCSACQELAVRFTSMRDPCNCFAVVLNHQNFDSTGA